jgi:hypothetical protein
MKKHLLRLKVIEAALVGPPTNRLADFDPRRRGYGFRMKLGGDLNFADLGILEDRPIENHFHLNISFFWHYDSEGAVAFDGFFDIIFVDGFIERKFLAHCLMTIG